ncbi:hypothetical protein L7F22_034595 [Adiantum nelumboides]|nr:hypothetical protein [Adiantum nelumboides]
MRGIMLIQPGFFTEKPVMTTLNDTKSPATLSVSGLEFIHRIALPEGAECGHPYVNPMHPQGLFKLSEIVLPPVLVAVAEDDILRPAGEQYYNALKEAGKSDVEFLFSEHVGHGFHLLDPSSKGVLERPNRMTQFIENYTS